MIGSFLSKPIGQISIVAAALLALVVVYGLGLSSIPSGFHNDEASFFLNAQYLRDTGMDEDGNPWPLFLRSFIDPKPALYSYLQIPFTAVLGDTVLAARTPSVLLGIGSVFVAYGLFLFFATKKAAFLGATLFAISPWMIMVARGTQEVMLSLFLGLSSLLVILVAHDRWLNPDTGSRHPRFWSIIFWVIGILLAILSMYAYHSAKIVLPILIPTLLLWKVWSFHSTSKVGLTTSAIRQQLIVATLAGAFLLLSMVLLTRLHEGGLERFRAVGVFSQPDVQLILDEQIRTATPHLSPGVIRVMHNKVVNYGLEISKRMSQYLSIEFLFFEGAQPTRYAVPRHGLLYGIEGLLILFGAVALVQGAKTSSTRSRRGSRNTSLIFLLLIWIGVGFLPGSLTLQEHPSMIRTAFVLPAISLIAALGAQQLWRSTTGKLRIVAATFVLIGYLGSVVYFVNQYVVQASNYRPWNRNLADQRLVEKVSQLESGYERVVISRYVSGQPYVYFALAGLISADELQTLNQDRTTGSYAIGKLEFAADACPAPEIKTDGTPTLATRSALTKQTTLYAIAGTCEIPPEYEIVAQITHADNAEAYWLIQPENQK